MSSGPPSRGGRGWRGPASASVAALVIAAGLTVWLLTRPAAHREPRVTTASPTTASPTTASPTTASPTTAPPTTAPPTAPLPAQPPPPGIQLGANVNLLFNARNLSAALIDRQLAALQATGATLARSDALWELTEPAPPTGAAHRYDWSFDDGIAAALAAHRLRWLPIVDYAPPWASQAPGMAHSPPRSAVDYAAYAGALATRYGPGGSFWAAHPELPAKPVTTFEIWNEPDSGEFWQPQPNAAAYADLYLAARAAIDAVDPTARVIVGGLTDPSAFLPDMVGARPQLRGHVDGVAIHPYGTPERLRARIAGARSTLTALGMASTPLYVTEFGWTTSPPGALDYVPESARPADIAQALAIMSTRRCGVSAALEYTWYSAMSDSADSQQWYGIDGLDAQPTPDTTAFAGGLRAAAAGGPAGAPCTAGG